MRNGSGTYSLPAGNPVVAGTTIDVAWANPTMSDIASALSGSVASDGQTPMSAPLRLDGGTAGSPGLTFNAETTMGLYRPLASILGFSTQGVERMRIVGGNLVIGSTTDGGQKLQVTGTTAFTGDTAITGDLAVSGTASVAAPTTDLHATNKQYVDKYGALTLVVTSDVSITAVAGTHYVLTNTSAAQTVTLPASPAALDQIMVSNATDRLDHVIARNGRWLFALAEDFTFSKSYFTIGLRYIDNTYGWTNK